MKRILLLTGILLFSCALFSQQAKIDSLNILYFKANEDTVRLRLLKQIAQEAYFVDSPTYKDAAERLLKLAEKTNHSNFIGIGHNAIGRYYEKIGADSIAKEHYLYALRRFKKINNQNGVGISLGNIAALFINNKDSSLHYLNKAIVVNKKGGFYNNLMYNYYNFGIHEAQQNNSEEALQNILLALHYAEKVNNERFIAYCPGMIGVLYLGQEMYNEAEKYLIRAKNKFIELDDSFGSAQQYNNLGKLYNERDNNYKKAIEFYRIAVNAYDKIGDSINKFESIGNIGRNYLQINYLGASPRGIKII